MNAAASPSNPTMAPRYVIRTVDEDWIDLFDAPARIEKKRPAWDEAKRRVREHPELKTVVLDRRTGATLWQSDPDIPPRYQVLAVDETVFYALDTDLSVTSDVLSSHKEKTSFPASRPRPAPLPSRAIAPQSAALPHAAGYGTFGAETRRREFFDSSVVRTDAQSRAVLESPRARVP